MGQSLNIFKLDFSYSNKLNNNINDLGKLENLKSYQDLVKYYFTLIMSLTSIKIFIEFYRIKWVFNNKLATYV